MKIVVPVSRTFPKRSRDRVFVAIGAFATVASHLPTTLTPHFSHYFSTNQDSPNSPTIYHSRVPWTNCPEGMCQGFRGSKQGSKRRVKSEPMHRSFLFPLPPTLIDACSIDKRAPPHTHLWHRVLLFIDRGIDRVAKIKPKEASSRAWNVCPMTSPRLLKPIYIFHYHTLQNKQLLIFTSVLFLFLQLPNHDFIPLLYFRDSSSMMTTIHSRQKWERRGRERGGGKEERGYLETLWRRGREVASDRRAICQPDSLCSDWTRVK